MEVMILMAAMVVCFVSMTFMRRAKTRAAKMAIGIPSIVIMAVFCYLTW